MLQAATMGRDTRLQIVAALCGDRRVTLERGGMLSHYARLLHPGEHCHGNWLQSKRFGETRRWRFKYRLGIAGRK